MKRFIQSSFILFWLVLRAQASSFMPKSFRADFVEEAQRKITKKVKKSFGKMDYYYPGNIRLELTKPDPLLFISNNKKTWLYRPAPEFIPDAKGELNVGSADQFGYKKLFDILHAGLKSNKNYSVKNEELESYLEFSSEMTKEIEISKAKLVFVRKEKNFSDLASIEFTKTNNRVRTIRFLSIDITPKFGAKNFIFLEKDR